MTDKRKLGFRENIVLFANRFGSWTER